MNRPILLDTCAAIWLADSSELSTEAVEALEAADRDGLAIALSPITAWEIGLLVARGRLALSRDPGVWFDDLLSEGLELAPLAPRTLVASSFLPGAALRDPADRILAATARALNYRLMTRDARLLEYGAAGHLSVIAC
ncbi:MAG TPA: type II toxin-antitoxin system VapC family toxin [Caulobacteraceae bacterium]|jgi:PIN domain nuclease of toxin-antitoxin system|nr:type II toxin-antitoxin system VapC family toxin [Caulobacteraceae bacterium]